MLTRHSIAAILLVGSLAGCGGGGSGGNPSAPAPTVTSLAITPATDMLRITGTETFVATAGMSNGTSNAVTASWRSSNPAAATIDSGGRSTTIASGTTSITAEYQGQSAAPRELRVVPDYQGTWRGRLNVRQCTDDGDWRVADFCRTIGTGDIDSISFALTQSRDSVTGTIDIGGFAGPATGSIATSGHLAFSGAYTTDFEGVPIHLAVSDGLAVSTDNTRMTGGLVFTFTSTMIAGRARVEADLLNVAKTAATLSSGSVSTGEGSIAEGTRAAVRRRKT